MDCQPRPQDQPQRQVVGGQQRQLPLLLLLLLLVTGVTMTMMMVVARRRAAYGVASGPVGVQRQVKLLQVVVVVVLVLLLLATQAFHLQRGWLARSCHLLPLHCTTRQAGQHGRSEQQLQLQVMMRMLLLLQGRVAVMVPGTMMTMTAAVAWGLDRCAAAVASSTHGPTPICCTCVEPGGGRSPPANPSNNKWGCVDGSSSASSSRGHAMPARPARQGRVARWEGRVADCLGCGNGLIFRHWPSVCRSGSGSCRRRSSSSSGRSLHPGYSGGCRLGDSSSRSRRSNRFSRSSWHRRSAICSRHGSRCSSRSCTHYSRRRLLLARAPL